MSEARPVETVTADLDPHDRTPGGPDAHDHDAWIAALEPHAPDVVAPFRAFRGERYVEVRREVRRRAGAGSAEQILPQLDAVAAALAAVVEALPDAAFELPGGESDWTVAHALGHDIEARQGLVLAAALAARNRWPEGAPDVVPGVPGAAGASRSDLLARLATSSRLQARAVRSIAMHELDPCPLRHPLVGRLRCGEWLLFSGVHDLMHLEQLHGLADQLAGARPAAALVADRR